MDLSWPPSSEAFSLRGWETVMSPDDHWAQTISLIILEDQTPWALADPGDHKSPWSFLQHHKNCSSTWWNTRLLPLCFCCLVNSFELDFFCAQKKPQKGMQFFCNCQTQLDLSRLQVIKHTYLIDTYLHTILCVMCSFLYNMLLYFFRSSGVEPDDSWTNRFSLNL